jgi:hypothetical protein
MEDRQRGQFSFIATREPSPLSQFLVANATRRGGSLRQRGRFSRRKSVIMIIGDKHENDIYIYRWIWTWRE